MGNMFLKCSDKNTTDHRLHTFYARVHFILIMIFNLTYKLLNGLVPANVYRLLHPYILYFVTNLKQAAL